MKLSFVRLRLAAVVMLTAFAIALPSAGCKKQGGPGAPAGGDAAGGAAAGAKKVVGFSQMGNDNPWRQAETKSMLDEARKRGYEIVLTDAQGKTEKQVSDIEDLISRNVSAIFIAPKEEEGIAPALAAAKAKKIPVFLLDREARGTPGEDFVCFIGSNFVEEGQRAGQWLVEKSGGTAGIIELTGTPGSSVARDRHDGFAAAIQGQPGMKILASQTGDFSRAQGQKVMENLIQAHGNAITVVYAHNDEMALGAIQALRAAGRTPGKDVLVIGVDGEKDALKAIVAGDMNVTVECNPRFGPIAFDTYEKFARGEAIPPKIINPDRFFDASNAAQFVEEAY
jgi:galactofuranose transport system substrate-binding protein